MITYETNSINDMYNECVSNRTFRKHRIRKERTVGLVAMYDPRSGGFLKAGS